MLSIACLATLLTTASAAAINPLLAELLAAPASLNVLDASATCTGPVVSTPSTFWLDQMDHTGNARGYAPELPGFFTYPVYRNVMSATYGAVNDGSGDQTSALQKAMNDDGQGGNRYSDNGYTIRPAEVFIPSGTYVSSHPASRYICAEISVLANLQSAGPPYWHHSGR
jgi:hypothetical protein